MADLDLVKRAAGTKLNDVLLAVVAGALRRLAVRRGEWPADLRVMVPVSIRADAGEGAGNRITFCFVTLPVAVADPRERLRRIRGETRALKGSGRIAGSELLLRSLDPLPGPFKARVARLAASPRMYNLTVSNVPGPPMTLYVAGARVASIDPVIPLSDGHALAVGALSYAGGMHIAVHADPFALPEAGDLPALFAEALDELLGAHGCDPSRELMAATAHPRGSPAGSLAGSRDGGHRAAGSSTLAT
jgi:WS/DGAT/MGAT family acyltransferase